MDILCRTWEINLRVIHIRLNATKFGYSRRSFTYKPESIGLRIEPWVTPWVIARGSNLFLLLRLLEAPLVVANLILLLPLPPPLEGTPGAVVVVIVRGGEVNWLKASKSKSVDRSCPILFEDEVPTPAGDGEMMFLHTLSDEDLLLPNEWSNCSRKSSMFTGAISSNKLRVLCKMSLVLVLGEPTPSDNPKFVLIGRM